MSLLEWFMGRPLYRAASEIFTTNDKVWRLLKVYLSHQSANDRIWSCVKFNVVGRTLVKN